ncbi:MAG TPA: hypothetical protein VGN12_05080 [Pirellulales bacterium]|jgi:hypothetical protein
MPNLLDRFGEWFASKLNPRFDCYRRARLLYESYLHEMGKPVYKMSPDDHRIALAHPGLHEAESLYTRAIELCDQHHALRDRAFGLMQRGMLFGVQDRRDEAIRDLADAERGLRACASGGDEVDALSDVVYQVGIIRLRSGNLDGLADLAKSREIDARNDRQDGVLICDQTIRHFKAVHQ